MGAAQADRWTLLAENWSSRDGNSAGASGLLRSCVSSLSLVLHTTTIITGQQRGAQPDPLCLNLFEEASKAARRDKTNGFDEMSALDTVGGCWVEKTKRWRKRVTSRRNGDRGGRRCYTKRKRHIDMGRTGPRSVISYYNGTVYTTRWVDKGGPVAGDDISIIM